MPTDQCPQRWWSEEEKCWYHCVLDRGHTGKHAARGSKIGQVTTWPKGDQFLPDPDPEEPFSGPK